MRYEFEVWIKFTQDGKTISTNVFFSDDSFEDCWDSIGIKEKKLRETYPEIRSEYMHSAVSERPDYSEYE